MSLKSAILLPLYIYPSPGAWEPLHEAISAHPDLNFTIILNPHNGPGSSPLPDANYALEIPRLNSRANVRTVGYVRVNYCKKDLTEVCQEVARYGGWSKDYAGSGLAVQGIFFDETPNQYSADVAAYLDTISRQVKDTFGILGDRMVIHNPGAIPDLGLADPGPDVTTVLEEPYVQYQSATLQERLGSLLPYDRTKCGYIVHSVPGDEVKRLVYRLRCRGEYLFVTDLREHFYERFGPSWSDFIEAMQMD